MSYVIARHGIPSMKFVNGVSQLVIPFVGADWQGQMGIGLMHPSGQVSDFKGFLVPHKIIRSWRAMKLLELVTNVDSTTLEVCLLMMQSYVHGDHRYTTDTVAEVVGGVKELEKVLDTFLSSTPPIAEFNMMATCFREKNIIVDGRELEAEVKAGRMKMTPDIEEIINETRERHRAHEPVGRKTHPTFSPESVHVLPKRGILRTIIALIQS